MKLLLVVFPFVLLAFHQALSVGASCSKRNPCPSKSECCVGGKTCETMTADLLSTTLAKLQSLPGEEDFAKSFNKTISQLSAAVPLTVNKGLCSKYYTAQLLIAKAAKEAG